MIGAILAFAAANPATIFWGFVGIGMSILSSRMAAKEPKRPGYKVNTRSTQETIPLVYGTQKLAGNDVYIENSGADNTWLWIVQVLAEGECESLEEVWYNELQYGDDDGVTDNSSHWFHTGSATQTVDPNLPGDWNDPLRNTCYIVQKMKFNPEVFNGLPKRMCVIKGRKLYDFRTSVTEWSANPVLALYDYLTNTRYGLSIDPSEIDIPSWTTVANHCEDRGWTLNRVYDVQESAQDVIDDICQHFRGQLAWFGGVFFLRRTEIESSVFDIDDEHIVQRDSGESTVELKQPSTWGTAQGMRVKYYLPDNNWVLDDLPIGNQQGAMDTLELKGCTTKAQATALGVYALERQMLNRSVSFLGRDDLLVLEPHDVVKFSCDSLSISDQLMRVVSSSITTNGLVNMSLQYESDKLYNSDFDASVDDVYSCSLPSPTPIPEVYGGTITEETYTHKLRTMTRLLVTFEVPADYIWFRHVEVSVSVDGAPYQRLFNASNDFMIDPVQEGKRYDVRLRTVNIFNAKSSEVYTLSATISDDIGSIPSSVDALHAILNGRSLSLYSERVADPEIEVYEFRMGMTWRGSVFIASLRSPNYSINGLKPGTHTFWVNTLDTSGNYGDFPRSATVTVPDIAVSPDSTWHDAYANNSTDNIVFGFYNNNQGWTPGSGTLTTNAGYSRFEPTSGGIEEGAITRVLSPISGSDNRWFGIRMRRVAGDGFMGTFRWKREGDTSWSSSRSILFSYDQPGDQEADWIETDGWGTEWIDIHGATQGASHWFGESIKEVRVVLAYEPEDAFDIDHIAISRNKATIRGSTGGVYHLRQMHGAWKSVDPPEELKGTYISPVHDHGTSATCTALIDTAITVTGGGTRWEDQLPTPATWSTVGVDNRWVDIFEYEGAPNVNITVYSAGTSPPVDAAGHSATDHAELLTCTQTGRYWQVGVEITDPNLNTHARVDEYTLNLYEE